MIEDQMLIENAILAFLHHYPNHEWAVPYAELLTKLRALKDEQPKDTTVQKRGRPAKRQRTKKATSNPSSTEKSKTTNQEA
jgi:hypothetical protein